MKKCVVKEIQTFDIGINLIRITTTFKTRRNRYTKIGFFPQFKKNCQFGIINCKIIGYSLKFAHI